MRKVNQQIDLEAVEDLFAKDGEILCMTDIPNFRIEDEYLNEDPGKTFTLFNVLKNLSEDEQWCAITEA